jgi:hypothetical protein
VFPVSSVFGYACGFDEEGDQLSAATVTEAVARWMVEAATLLAIGKPSDSPITLVFDEENIISERRDDTIEEWENAWFIASQRDFQTVPPLPSWHIIRAGHVIPIAI